MMTKILRRLSAIFALCILLVGLPPSLASEKGDAERPETHGFQIGPERRGVKWESSAAPVHLAALEEEADLRGTLTMVVAGTLKTMIVKEFHVWTSENRDILAEDAEGNWVVVDRVTARTFRGTVSGDDNSFVLISIDVPVASLYGMIYTEGRRIDMSPFDTPAVAGVRMIESRWSNIPNPVPAVFSTQGHGGGAEDLSPLDASSVETVQIVPFVDTPFQAVSDHANRITNALAAEHGLWDDAVSIHIVPQPIRYTGSTWSTGCEAHIASFSSHIAGLRSQNPNPLPAGSDFYQLFTGVDLIDCHGTGYGPLYNQNGSPMTDVLGTHYAVSIVRSIDSSRPDGAACYSCMNPDTTHDLSIVAAQEMGHNAGEGAHRDDRYCAHYMLGVCDWWKYNTMCCDVNGVYVPDMVYWFTAATSNAITTYTYPQQSTA